MSACLSEISGPNLILFWILRAQATQEERVVRPPNVSVKGKFALKGSRALTLISFAERWSLSSSPVPTATPLDVPLDFPVNTRRRRCKFDSPGANETSMLLVSLGRQITPIGASLRNISGQPLRATSAGSEDHVILNSLFEFLFGQGCWLGALPAGWPCSALCPSSLVAVARSRQAYLRKNTRAISSEMDHKSKKPTRAGYGPPNADDG